MKSIITPLIALIALTWPAGAQEILSTDFNSASIRAYANGQAIGRNPGNEMTVRLGMPDAEIRVAPGKDGNVLEFVTGSKATGDMGVGKVIPREIGEAEFLQLKGSVVFTPLHATGRSGTLLIALNSGDWFTTSSKVTAIHIVLQGDRQLKYVSADGTRTALQLKDDQTYRIDYSVDFFSNKQNTWEFSVYEEGNSTKPVFTSGLLNTRPFTLIPGIFVLSGVDGASPEPFVAVHGVDLRVTRIEKGVSRSQAMPVAPAPPDDDSIICNHARIKNQTFPELRCKNAIAPNGILLFPRDSTTSLELPVQNDLKEDVPATYRLSVTDRRGQQLALEEGRIVLNAGTATPITYALHTGGFRYGVYILNLRVETESDRGTEREYYFGVISDTIIPKAADGAFLYGLDPNYGSVISKSPPAAIPGKPIGQGQYGLTGWFDAMGVDILRGAGMVIGPAALKAYPSVELNAEEVKILRQHGLRVMGMAVPLGATAEKGFPADDVQKWEFLVEKAARQLPGITYWEVGNEPDLEKTPIELYTQIYEKTYRALKAGNPDAVVMNGGITFHGEKGQVNSRRFLELVNPALIDVIAYHAHGPGSQAERSIYEFTRKAADESGMKNKALADTESGMFVGSKRQEDVQAWMVVQKQAFAQSVGLRFLMTFRLHAFRSEREWSLLRSDQEPKPAVLAYRTMTEHLKGLSFQQTLKFTQTHAEGYSFAKPGGTQRACLVWSNQPTFYNGYIQIAASAAQAENVRLMDIFGNVLPVQVREDGVVHLEITEEPVYLLWEAKDPRFQATVSRSLLRVPDVASVVPYVSYPLDVVIENHAAKPLTATLSAAISSDGDSSVSPARQTVTVPAGSETPVRLELNWVPGRSGLEWPKAWTIYTDVPETEVHLENIQDLPSSLAGSSGRRQQLVQGRINLLGAGDLPREKRAGFVFGVIKSDRAQTVRIGCAADWWMEAYLNGKVVCSTLQEGNRGLSVTERTIDLPLKPGSNLLSFKVLSGKGDWALMLADPGTLSAQLEPRKARDCLDILLEADGKKLAEERVALTPVRRVLASEGEKAGDSLDSWKQRNPDFLLENAQVTNLYDKEPERTKWWQGLADLSATAWMRDNGRIEFIIWAEDDQDVTGSDPAHLWQYDSLQLAFSRDGKTMNQYTVGRIGADAVIHKDIAAGGLPSGTIAPSSTEITARVERLKTGTLYRISLDRTLVGDGVFAWNFAINDNDQGSRKQFIQWTEGLCESKNPALWNKFILPPSRQTP